MIKSRVPYISVFVACLLAPTGSFAQVQPPLPASLPAYSATPAHSWELGLHSGIDFTLGDIDFVPNWAAGFHLRRAIDYVFSLRGEALAGQLKHDDKDDGVATTTFQSGSLQLLVSVNNLQWNALSRRKSNFYVLAGVGITRYKVEVVKKISPELTPLDYRTQTHSDVGVGIAIRLNERCNLGFESKAQIMFGKDKLDGVDREGADVVSYSSVRLNFNLGNKDKRSEPLYWVNPLEVLMNDVSELKKRPAYDLKDTDKDGVIDLTDQDNNTPEGIAVDTRGLPLDSDSDGIPNFQDADPYTPAGKKLIAPNGQPYLTEEEIQKMLDKQSGEPGIPGNENSGGNIADWFLPMIHFNIDSYKIRFSEYGNLSGIAKVMKGNLSLRVVVTGFTDKTASDAYNKELSYQRAKAAIEHLVNEYSIARQRFILQYNGESAPLVPSTGSSLMNRRVEFRTATEFDYEMGNPGASGKSRSRK